MRLSAVFALALLITPLAAGAAGFAKESIFLSKNPTIEGEVVFIHSVVTNPADTAFAGDVVFKHGDTQVGKVAVTLAAGGAEAVSVSWQPVAGSHTIKAELTAKDGTVVASEDATFSVQAKPANTEAATTTRDVESSAKIKETIANISPQAAEITTPVFATIDSLRQKSVEALTKGEAWAKQKTENPQGEVAGDTSEAGGGAVHTVMSLVATLLLYVFSLLKFVVSNAGVFYPVLAVAFLYTLWRVFKRMRRPSY